MAPLDSLLGQSIQVFRPLRVIVDVESTCQMGRCHLRNAREHAFVIILCTYYMIIR